MLRKLGITLIVIGLLVILGLVIYEIYTVDPEIACAAFGVICLFAGIFIIGFTG